MLLSCRLYLVKVTSPSFELWPHRKVVAGIEDPWAAGQRRGRGSPWASSRQRRMWILLSVSLGRPMQGCPEQLSLHFRLLALRDITLWCEDYHQVRSSVTFGVQKVETRSCLESRGEHLVST